MSNWSKTIRRTGAYVLVRSLAGVVNAVPRRLALGVGGRVGVAVYHLGSDLRQTAIDNIRRIHRCEVDQARAMARRVFRQSGRNAVDALRVRRNSSTIDRDTFLTPETLEEVEGCAKRGGALIIGPHLGCWEFLGVLLVRHGVKMLVPATPVRNRRLDRFVRDHRLSMGVHTCPRSGSMTTLVDHVRSGGAVGLMMDQDTRVASIPASFLGYPAATPVGPAVLAERTGAPVYCASLRFGQEDRQELRFERVPLDDLDLSSKIGLHSATERFNRYMEGHIVERPDQWVWYHRRWRRRVESLGRKIGRTSAAAWFFAAILGCSEAGDPGTQSRFPAEVTPHQEVQTFELEETHGGATAWRLRADRARIVRGEDTRLGAMCLVFLSDIGETLSTVVADSGRVPDGTEHLSAYGNVEVRNAEGVRVLSDSLRYVRAEDRIRTDADVAIHRGEDVIRGKGLESDPALEDMSIREQVSGRIAQEPGPS